MSQDQGDKQQDSGAVQGLAVGVGGTVVGGGLVAAILAPQYRMPILVFLVVALILVVAAGAIILAVRSRRRKDRAAGIEKEVTGEFDRQAAASNDKDLKARLEEMKRKFMLLIGTLREEGHQNIYEMPWFLTLGPSGSGKSWVLKGSGLEPLDDTQWKGGTFLIDWWSCSEALVLDTAGGVVFREEKGYDSPEWQSLLGLLKKHRPQCPINGLLVMVPAQLLWLKPEELPAGWLSLDDYANALRFQIRKRLQRDLGIRFPVYFLVTQTDRVPGFREFADALEEKGKPKGQMLGWSIPVEVGKKPLKSANDKGGDPELEEIKIIDERLRQVAADLRRQRLALLRNYAGDGARADELGMIVRKRAADLFAFPDAIQSTLAPRLQELLVQVFKPDPTLPKMPPYLRGVYFTSSLREGAVLDRQSTGVVGKTLTALALPGGADNEQPRPFFLKDLVFEKAFMESWLVTPLVQARSYLQQRRRTLILSGIGAGLLLLVAIGIGGCSYSRTVGSELVQWQEAKAAVTNSAGKFWLPVVKEGSEDVQLDDENLHRQEVLAKAASASLKRGGFWSLDWLFRMSKLNDSRRKAQLHLFERGVIQPMDELAWKKSFSAANDRMQFSDQPSLAKESKQFEEGLLALLELELNTNRTGKGYDWDASRDRVMGGLANYLLAGQKDEIRSQALRQLKTIFDLTYLERRQEWPPQSERQPVSLSNLVKSAFVHISLLQSNQANLFHEKRERLRGLVAEAWRIWGQEKDLITDIEHREPEGDLTDKAKTLGESWSKLATGLKTEHVQLFRAAFTNFAQEVKSDTEGRQEGLRQRMKQVNGALAGTNFTPVLAWRFAELTNDVPQIERLLEEFKDLDENAATLDVGMVALAPTTGRDGRPLLGQRLGVYDQVINLQVPSTRQWERDLFEEAKDTKETIDGIEKSAIQACAALQKGLFGGLTNGTATYADVLCRYVEFRYLEKLLERGEMVTTNVIGSGDYDVELTANRKPRDMLIEVGNALARLKRSEAVWEELKLKWKSLDHRESRPIKHCLEAISTKRDSLLNEVPKQIEKEWEEGKRFPLAAQGAPLSEREVVKSRERASLWLQTVRDLPPEAKVIPSKTRQQWEGAITDDWLGRFHLLVDDRGEVLDYEVKTPWESNGESVLKNLLRDDGAFEKAKQAAGLYRSWTIDGKSLQADDPRATVSVSASSGFSIEARKDEGHPLAKITRVPRSDGWTIIAMLDLADRRSKAPTYLVPIDVVEAGGQEPATVWFVIRPIQTRTSR